MRFIFGLIVGCLLTIGVAYVHDAAYPAATADADNTQTAAIDGRMVNWAVVNHNLSDLHGWVSSQWAWISTKFSKAG